VAVAMSISFCTLFSPFQFFNFFLFETQLMGIIPIYDFFSFYLFMISCTS